jgi:ABC-type multidrug transport system ATPase subunit
MNLLIRTHGLTKDYSGMVVVDDVSLAVPEGSLFGFLGPNGSGKTTTIRMLLGLVFASSGDIEMFGKTMPESAGAVLRDIGVLVEGPGFYPYMSGRKNLMLLDAAGPRPRGASRSQGSARASRVDEVLDRVGLAHVGKRPVKVYSLGMRQRLGLAAALLQRPRLLILDEPTNGLDPNGIHELRQLFVALVEEGTTVFLSSHQLAEVEMICTDVAMMSAGKLVVQDRVEALTAPTGRVFVDTPDVALLARTVDGLSGPRVLDTQGERVLLHLDGIAPEALSHRLVTDGVRLRSFAPEIRTLESVFLERTDGDALR